MMPMISKHLAILALLSQASAFTVAPQSRSSLSVSYLVLVEIQRSQAQSLSHPVSFHSAFLHPLASRLAQWWKAATKGQRSQTARIR
jgi:catechol-2,3-dioxygenase